MSASRNKDRRSGREPVQKSQSSATYDPQSRKTLTPSPLPAVTPQTNQLTTPGLTAAQTEFLDDLRVSLNQMQQGNVQQAREALREIRHELNAEDDGNSSDG